MKNCKFVSKFECKHMIHFDIKEPCDALLEKINTEKKHN